jgi:ribosomal protein S18 acetylase RimI-like enzyme
MRELCLVSGNARMPQPADRTTCVLENAVNTSRISTARGDMPITFRPMRATDYQGARLVWQGTPGIGLSSADSKKSITSFLKRNRGTSFVALYDKEIVGTALCGHDGRRGYLYHLAVRQEYQGSGIGTVLTDRCIRNLKKRGIKKIHLFVYTTNEHAVTFYRNRGWQERNELLIFSKTM